MADLFREAMRSAKDCEAVMAASRDIVEEIEKVAGHERADSISVGLARLLPLEASSGLPA